MKTMEREQTTIRLPAELKAEIQQQADKSFKQTTLRIEKTLYSELETIAKLTGLTITSLLIVAIWQSVLTLKHLPQ